MQFGKNKGQYMLARVRFLAFAVAAFACLTAVPTPALAVQPQYLCTAPGVTPGSECAAIRISPWRWTGYNLGYGKTISGWYHSESAVEQAVHQAFTAPGATSWCSMTHTSTVNGSPAAFQYGVGYRAYDYFYYDVVAHHSNNPPCVQAWQHVPSVQRHRSLSCNAGFTLIYEAGPPAIGPYCARPWGVEAEERSYGNCEGGALVKGNPCNVTSRNKYHEEVDYKGSGDFPIVFKRAYNSLRAKRYGYAGGSTFERFEPVGIGWTASYFQRLTYSGANGTLSVYAHRPDGKEIFFSQSGSSFEAEVGRREKLSASFGSGGSVTSFFLTTQDGFLETYDASGRLLEVSDRGGIKHTVGYDSRGVIDSVTHTSGAVLTIHVSQGNFLTKIVDPAGGEISYQYDYRRNLTGAVYQDSTSRSYHYEVSSWGRYNQLTGVTAEGGARHSWWSYADDGSIAASSNGAGVNAYTFSYTTNGRVVTDPKGVVRTYGTAVLGGVRRLTSSSSTCGGCLQPKAQAYDVRGNVTLTRDFRDIETHFTYDTNRNLELSRTHAFGTPSSRTVSSQWHPVHDLPVQIDEPGRTITFNYDASGSLLGKSVTDVGASASRSWSYSRNALGQLLNEDGPRSDVSDVTAYAYYSCSTGFECGQLQSITNPKGHVTTFDAYDAHGQPTQVTAPNSVVTTLAYDLRQRLTARCVNGLLPTCSGGELTSIDYWPTGLLKKVTLPGGEYTAYAYDAAHRLTQVSDSAGNTVTYTLDAMGNRTAENVRDAYNVLRLTHSRVYNTLNRLYQDVNAASTGSATTTYGYDNNGNLTSSSAPLGRNASNLYDELNRLKQITDPANGITYLAYDAQDNLIGVTDPTGNSTGYAYNGFGELTAQVSPDTGTTIHTYDSAGNLDVSVDARGAATDFSYDALNRVTSVAYTLSGSPSQTISFAYDQGVYGRGQLTSAADADHAMSWTHDAHGRVTGAGTTVGGLTHSVGYGYANGRLTSITLPSGNVVTYGHDAVGRVASVSLGSTTILSNATWQPFGQVDGWTWGNGVIHSRGYDEDGRLTSLASSTADGVNLGFGYDAASRITSKTDTGTSPVSWTYGYDSLDRLTSAVGPQTQGWSYDANGNRLSETGANPSTYTVSGTSNRLTAVSGALSRAYSYDGAGNTLSDGVLTLTYNARNRLAAAQNGANARGYVYDALGQLIAASGTGGTTRYAYDLEGRLIGEYDATGALIQETVWLGDIPVATIRPGTMGGVGLFYVHADHLNTPRKLVEPSNNATVWRWESDAFGNGAPDQDPDGNSLQVVYNLRFPGQVYDAVTGLNYNYFRDYDPTVGRYTQSDPIGLSGGLNTYAYVGGNPNSFTDSKGLFIDVLFDAGSLAYGLYRIVKDNIIEDCDNLGTNLAAVGADFAAMWIPGVTGAGIGVRAARALPTPAVANQKLQNIVNNLYKGTTNPNRIGNGTTADAIRHELATGAPVGGKFHAQKGQESIRALENWLKGNPNATYRDRVVAESLLNDLRSAVRGDP